MNGLSYRPCSPLWEGHIQQKRKFGDQFCRHVGLDANEQLWIARDQQRGQADAGLKDYRHIALKQSFDDRRDVAIGQIHIENCRRDGLPFKQRQRLVDGRSGANDRAACIFDGEGEIQGNEDFIFRNKNSRAIEDRMASNEGGSVDLTDQRASRCTAAEMRTVRPCGSQS